MKKLTAFVLALLMCLAALPAFAWTADEANIESIRVDSDCGDLVVEFSKVKNATEYVIYRGVDGASLTRYATTTADEAGSYWSGVMAFVDYDETPFGHIYTYAAAAVVDDVEGAQGTSMSFANIPMLADLEVEETEAGIVITLPEFTTLCDEIRISRWDGVPGSGYTDVASFASDTTETTCLDKAENLTEDTQYTYYAASYNKTVGNTGYSYGEGTKCWWQQDTTPDAPENVWLDNTATGVRVGWPSVSDADTYNVYRKVENGTMEFLRQANDYFTDEDVVNGTRYEYGVKTVESGVESKNFGVCGVILYLAEPELTLKNTKDGVKITWTQLDNVYYSVKRFEGDPSDGYWETIGDEVVGSSFVDTAVTEGEEYKYALRAFHMGFGYSSNDDYVGKSIVRKAPTSPELTSVANTAKGVQVKWEADEEAAQYTLERICTTTPKWTKVMTSATATSYTDTDVISGDEYAYRLRISYTDGTSSDADEDGMGLIYLACPALPTLTNTKEGIKLTWNEVEGAQQYRIYRKMAEGDEWIALADTEDEVPAFVDDTVVSGNTYWYTVQAMDANAEWKSVYKSEGKSITVMDQPALPKAAAVAKGVKLTWTATDGAAKYIVYRKTGTGAWAKLTETTGLTYTDTGVTSGTKYRYTLSAKAADGTVTAYNTTGRGFTYLTYPALPTLANAADGIQVTWTAVTKAKEYVLYRKTAGSSWKAITTTAELTYTDTDVQGGTEYTYTLRAKASDGSTSTYKSAGKSILCLEQPALPKVAAVAKGLKLTWTATKGAAKYIVYRKQAGTSYKAIATTDALTFTDTTVEGATKYRYTVKAVAADGTRSTCDTKGKGYTYLTYPALPTLTKTTKGVKVAWKAVEGAAKYAVYRKTADTSWKALTTTESLTFTDTTAVKGNEYFYTVKAKASDGSASTYKSAGKAIQY